MLIESELQQLFDKFETPEIGQKRIQWIRQNAPIRTVGGGAKAVKVRYVPVKMPFVLEAEAFNTEYAALVTYDHDEETLEIYAQPAQLKIFYINRMGKKVSPYITPDLFLIQKSGFSFVECKTEDELRKLAQQETNRYRVDESGRWSSPPAEAAANELGCKFVLRSTKENNWALIENFEFLKDYLTENCPPVPEEAKASLLGYFAVFPWASVSDLVKGELQANADWIYTLIVQRALFFDLLNDRLGDFDHALIFRDQDAAAAYGLFARSQVGLAPKQSAGLNLEVGARFIWDGRNWEISNVGEKFISARSLDDDRDKSPFIELFRDQLAQLAADGKISVPPRDEERERVISETQELLRGCSPKQLREATLKHGILFGQVDSSSNLLVDRKERARAYWLANWRQAEQRYGYGFLGLVPNLRHTQGNKNRKLPSSVIEIMQVAINQHWASPKRKRMTAIYGAVLLNCKEAGIDPPSRPTLREEIKRQLTHKNLTKRLGNKAAYIDEPEYLALEYTTPRHGTRPFHIGHIDHTPLDIVLVDRSLVEVIKSLWLSLLIDAYSRKVLAFYLSYDPPSYRSNMMIIRECVRRHGRLPMFIVVDQGSDFNSTYFEQALASFRCNKKERPGGKARFGSVIERFFKTSQEQFIYSLMGNTQAYVNFRQVSPEVNPARHAAWTFEQLRVRLNEYFEQVYHKNTHDTLGCSPEQKFLDGMTLSGSRVHTLISYNRDFLISTCPSTSKGTARITQHGVKINYLFYQAPVFHLPGVKGMNVPVRYEPFNKGLAYAYVHNKWHELYSEHYALFCQYSERSIKIASTHLHLLQRQQDKAHTINAERLAVFLRSTDGEELLQIQQRREVESHGNAITHDFRLARTPEKPPLAKPKLVQSDPKLLDDF